MPAPLIAVLDRLRTLPEFSIYIMEGLKQGTKGAYERGCRVQPLQTFIAQGTETCDWNLMIGRQFTVFICYREKSLLVFVHSLRDEGWLVGER